MIRDSLYAFRFSIPFLLILLLCGITGLSFAQPQSKKPKATGDLKKADDYFKDGNFASALEEYLVLVKKDPNNEKYNYRIGVCYINTDIDKPQAAVYLEKIKDRSTEPETKYLLGRAYQYSYKFDDAIKSFEEYKKEGKGSSDNMKDVELEIQYCINAKEIIKYPVNVSFENLGKNVNSEYADYYPFVPADESFLIFNSKRPESTAYQYPDGSWTSTIYSSKVKEGQFAKAQKLGRVINAGEGEEEAVGLSSTGDYLLVYYDNLQGSGDIFISKADKARNFKEPMILDDQINSMKGQEIAASITSDANSIYFASTRPGGLGGSDLYVCRRLPNGKWGPAQNLGPDVNTPYNEDFPNISPDGSTLYFSSMGHTGMGGYDIFFAKYDEKTNLFTDAKNLGYPINTPQDDMNFRVSANGKYGYISARRKDGFGDLDIYRLDFLDVDPDYTVITGKVRSLNPAKRVDSTHVSISVLDAKTGEEFGNYLPNPSSGKFVIILPPGKFTIHTETAGYLPYNEKIEILGKSSFKAMLEKNIMLVPEGGK